MEVLEIRAELLRKGLTPAGLCQRLGVGRWVWRDLVSAGPGGEGTQTRRLAEEIAKELGKPVEEVFPGKEAA